MLINYIYCQGYAYNRKKTQLFINVTKYFHILSLIEQKIYIIKIILKKINLQCVRQSRN